jgi:uncharacterized protein (DUF885 family)
MQQQVIPSFTRLRAFLNDTYLPKSRDSVGMSAMKGGPAVYAYLVAVNTTTSLTPDSIHKLGLSEVARITAAMDSIRSKVGFSGDLKAFSTTSAPTRNISPHPRRPCAKGTKRSAAA